MLIATLIRHSLTYHFDKGLNEPVEIIYSAANPFDGELLTGWFPTISQVDEALEELNDTVNWGLNIASYAGESDVPTRTSGE